MPDQIMFAFEELLEGVRVATKDGRFTQYCLGRQGGQEEGGKNFVPFPSYNFSLTTSEHQEMVQRTVEAAGYVLVIPPPG